MKVDFTKLPKSEIELKIEVPAQEWQEFLDGVAKELSKEFKIEGFRPGFAPLKLVEEKVGIARILEEAAENCIQKCYVRAILENKIEAIGQPEVSVLKLAKDNPFEFKAKVAVMPEIKLPDYKKIVAKIERKKISVREKEVEDALAWLQKSRAKLTLKLGPCEIGDWVEIEYSCPQIENNKKIEDAFVLGEGKMLPGFEENLAGMAENQEKKIFLAFPKDHFSKELAGKEIEFQVKLKSIKKLELPEITDEFARSMGDFSDLAGLKKSLQEGISLEKENAESQRVRNVILEKIAEGSQIDIPQILIVREQNTMLNGLKQDICQKLGMTIEDYLTKIKKTEKEVMDSFFSEAEKRIKNSLVLKEVSKKENIKISDEEEKSEMQKILIKYPDLKKLDSEQLKSYTKEVLENEKTFKLLESFVKKP
jgi:trigger factor